MQRLLNTIRVGRTLLAILIHIAIARCAAIILGRLANFVHHGLDLPCSTIGQLLGLIYEVS